MDSFQHEILIIEDDPRIREMVELLLEPEGIRVQSAKDGETGLSEARRSRPELILLDLALPGLSGFDVLGELRSEPQTESTPVIILTALHSTPDKVKGFELGATDYLTKPFSPAELLARVRSALRAKKLQDALSKANGELMTARIAAEANARAKADLLAHMSHEIRTPLNGILGMAGLLRQTELDADQQGYAETILSSSEALLGIIGAILDLSKIESDRLELESQPFSLRACFEEALDMLGAKAAEKQIDLGCEIEEGLPEQIIGDITRIRQVIVNLLGNAVKFTSVGEVFLRVRSLASPSDSRAFEDPWHLHFSVQDTGIGIEAERLAKLFKPFAQADAATFRRFGGTGLGLVISKRLVELMGGKMWVESMPGKGSTFHLTLPLRAAKPVNVPERSVTTPALQGRKVLIVDDNRNISRMLTEMAAGWGMIARSTTDAAEAIQWVQNGEAFDVGLIDFQMPNNDGIKIATTLSTLSGAQKIPLILMCPVGTRLRAEELTRAGIVAHTSKPLKESVLRDIVGRTVSERTAGPKAQQIAPAQALSLGSKFPLQVLICDDNQINQKVATKQIEQLGYKPDVATNGVQAVAAAEGKHYDLIFMDVMMPEMDGLQATKLIRERESLKGRQSERSVIVAMTASAMKGDREKCLESGMDDYLAKPVRLGDLKGIIEKWGQKLQEAQNGANSDPEHPVRTDSKNSAEEGQPVDMARLNDLTDGNTENFNELVTLYLEQTAKQLAKLGDDIQSRNAEEIRRTAHSAAGASATCGVGKLAAILREIENKARERQLSGVDQLYQEAKGEFGRARLVLEKRLKKATTVTK